MRREQRIFTVLTNQYKILILLINRSKYSKYEINRNNEKLLKENPKNRFIGVTCLFFVVEILVTINKLQTCKGDEICFP